jgi:segregation and condensation protein A
MVELQIEGFRGPISLLVAQVEEGRIDPLSLSLAKVATNWWEEAKAAKAGPQDIADFMVAMARLLQLKAHALLPGHHQPPPQQDEEERALEQWPFLQQAAAILRAWEAEGRRTYPRPARLLPPSSGLKGVTMDQLARLVQEALQARPGDGLPLVPQQEAMRLEETISRLRQTLSLRGGPMPFRELLATCTTRREVIVLFLALLELIKRGEAWAEQEAPFAEIVIVPA